MCDSVNQTRFPKEDHLPDWARRNNIVTKGDRVDNVLESSCNVMAHGDAREGEVKGKLANAVGSQHPSHYLGTWCIQHYYRWCAHLGYQQSTELTPPPADLNGLVRFARKTKSSFCACAVTFQLASTIECTGLAIREPTSPFNESYVL